MTSNSLQQLRSLSKEQHRLYSSYKSKLTQINELYAPHPQRDMMVQQLIHQHRAQLSTLQQRRQSALEDIQARAAQRNVAGTPEGRQKIVHALEHGFDLYSLAQQLVSEGDRAGLASLRAYLPYAAKAGFLPGSIKEANETLDRHESQLWSDKEIAAEAEAREAAISDGFMAENEKRLHTLMDHGTLSQAHKEEIRDLFRWQGLPESTTPKGLFNPNETIAEE